jgi:parallel beta-helix repeat protein
LEGEGLDGANQRRARRRSRLRKLLAAGAVLAILGTVAVIGLNRLLRAKAEAEGPVELQVSQFGHEGQFHTIGEALRVALPGARIHVAVGTYRESLVLNKEVEIIGEGPASAVVVESPRAECLRMNAKRAKVCRLTLRGPAGQQEKLYAVDIAQGALTLEECAITSDTLVCVAIHGTDTDAVLRRCEVHGGKQAGIHFFHHAKGTVENCWIHESTQHNIIVGEWSEAIMRGGKVSGGKEAGVYFVGGGNGTVEDCDIGGNKYGVLFAESANSVVQRCRIEGNYLGIRAPKPGKRIATVRDCDLKNNTAGPADIDPRAEVKLALDNRR